MRCRRESKECYFSATRRKRKTEDGNTSSVDADGDGEDDYMARNGRKRPRPGADSPPAIDRKLFSDVPLTPGGGAARSQPLRRPGDSSAGAMTVASLTADYGSSGSSASTAAPARAHAGAPTGMDGEANTPLENLEARTVMRREVYGPHDALDLLYKAATDRCVAVCSIVPPV